MDEWLDAVQWGTVPSWFGGLALLLALALFRRDRRRDDREQVDKVAIWVTTKHQLQGFGTDGRLDRIEEIEFTVHASNANDVPIGVHATAVEIETRWAVPDGQWVDEQGMPHTWVVQPGTQASKLFPERFLLPPNGNLPEHAQKHHVGHHAPENATQLDLVRGAHGTVRWFLAVDNAGRRWEVRPGIGKRARRIRWYSRHRPFYPGDWKNPLIWPIILRYHRVRKWWHKPRKASNTGAGTASEWPSRSRW